ncbi:MAG: hypothetical protein EBT72_03465 [Flavobacteriia bacterium]|nr:hypothetical protein [Flavobacteriia bacterium]
MKKIFAPTNLLSVLEEQPQAVSTSELTPELLGITDFQTTNAFQVDALERHKIYHIDTLKKVCIDYRLRFLDLRFFKGALPEAAYDKIAALEEQHQTHLKGFKIMAPSILFRLVRTDDPLLFVPLGNNYYYLIHKWGNDLSPFRKAMVWPFRSIWALLITLLVMSYGLTAITPMGLFTKTPDASAFWMLYFFMFKALASIVLFIGFALGKNFNPAIWNNTYNKT